MGLHLSHCTQPTSTLHLLPHNCFLFCVKPQQDKYLCFPMRICRHPKGHMPIFFLFCHLHFLIKPRSCFVLSFFLEYLLFVGWVFWIFVVSWVWDSPVLFTQIVFPAAPLLAVEARVSGPPPRDHFVLKLHLALDSPKALKFALDPSSITSLHCLVPKCHLILQLVRLRSLGRRTGRPPSWSLSHSPQCSSASIPPRRPASRSASVPQNTVVQVVLPRYRVRMFLCLCEVVNLWYLYSSMCDGYRMYASLWKIKMCFWCINQCLDYFCVRVDGNNFLELACWSYSCCEELRLLPCFLLPTMYALILVILGWTWDVLF